MPSYERTMSRRRDRRRDLCFCLINRIRPVRLIVVSVSMIWCFKRHATFDRFPNVSGRVRVSRAALTFPVIGHCTPTPSCILDTTPRPTRPTRMSTCIYLHQRKERPMRTGGGGYSNDSGRISFPYRSTPKYRYGRCLWNFIVPIDWNVSHVVDDVVLSQTGSYWPSVRTQRHCTCISPVAAVRKGGGTRVLTGLCEYTAEKKPLANYCPRTNYIVS